jgi:hypothetical protein
VLEKSVKAMIIRLSLIADFLVFDYPGLRNITLF